MQGSLIWVLISLSCNDGEIVRSLHLCIQFNIIPEKDLQDFSFVVSCNLQPKDVVAINKCVVGCTIDTLIMVDCFWQGERYIH